MVLAFFGKGIYLGGTEGTEGTERIVAIDGKLAYPIPVNHLLFSVNSVPPWSILEILLFVAE
jgi:hypothetical protein